MTGLQNISSRFYPGDWNRVLREPMHFAVLQVSTLMGEADDAEMANSQTICLHWAYSSSFWKGTWLSCDKMHFLTGRLVMKQTWVLILLGWESCGTAFVISHSLWALKLSPLGTGAGWWKYRTRACARNVFRNAFFLWLHLHVTETDKNVVLGEEGFDPWSCHAS